MGDVVMLRKAKATVDAMFREAMALEEDARNSLLKHAMLAGQQARLNAMIESARSHANVVKYTDFDADPYLFNTANVTIDLRSGKARKHDRKDLITKMSPVTYDPEAKCPRWLQFLDEIMLGDETKVDFLKRARGYGLPGDIREKVFFILWVAGRNGKGVFKDTCHCIMGLDQYVKPASFEMFTVRKGDEKLNKKCTAKRNNGKRCGAWALKGKTKCALHSDPELAARMGAKHGRGIVEQPDPNTPALLLPKTALEVRDALAEVMAQVQMRTMDTKTANALAYVGTSLLRAIEVSELEERLKRMQFQMNCEEDKTNDEP